MLEFAEVIMKSPKKMTNAEFMQQLMNYSPLRGLDSTLHHFLHQCLLPGHNQQEGEQQSYERLRY
jgi:hypothetical protein